MVWPAFSLKIRPKLFEIIFFLSRRVGVYTVSTAEHYEVNFATQPNSLGLLPDNNTITCIQN